MKYYTTTRIREKEADFNIVVGERSNGKSTAVLMDIVKLWHEKRRAGAVVRQMELDIMGAKGAAVFNYLVSGGHIADITENEWTGVVYRQRAWFLSRETEDGEKVVEKEPFAYAFALSQTQHYKSLSFPNIGLILFDEFIPETGTYLPDEVARFQSILSTLVRGRSDVVIFLVANTVTWNSPYLKKYTHRGIRGMKPGELDVHEFKKVTATGSELVMTVAVEYCESTAKSGGKPSDKYFVIDDARARMIVDGQFAVPDYPPCPHAFTTKNVKVTAWVQTDDRKLRVRIIRVERELFALVESVSEEQYTGYADGRRDLFYSMDYDSSPNHHISFLHPSQIDRRTALFASLIASGKIFFSGVDDGEDFVYYVRQAADFNILTA